MLVFHWHHLLYPSLYHSLLLVWILAPFSSLLSAWWAACPLLFRPFTSSWTCWPLLKIRYYFHDLMQLILIYNDISIYFYLWNLFDVHAYPTLHWRGLRMRFCFAAGDGLCFRWSWCCVRVIAIGILRRLSSQRDFLITIYFLSAWSCFSTASSLRGFLVSEIDPVNFFFRPIDFLVARVTNGSGWVL